MGLFFFVTAAYLLFFPLYSWKTQSYALRQGVLDVPVFLGRRKQIRLESIVDVRDVSSPIDRREGCRSFEIEYKDSGDETSFYEVLSALNAADLEQRLKRRAIVEEGKKEQKKTGLVRESSIEGKNLRVLVISAAIFGVILLYLGFLLLAPPKGGVERIERVQDNSIFLYARLTKQLMDSNILIGTFGKDVQSCCSELSDNRGEISYPYVGDNQTIYLVDRFTMKPLEKLSREYISGVYLCVAKGLVPDNYTKTFFGDAKMSFWTCKWRWMGDKCCMPWHGPK
jgi:hypothetical protein